MIKRIPAGLLALALVPLALPAFAQDASPIRDQDRAAFETLYREKLNSVNRTRSSDDDNELIDEMLSLAQEVPDDVGVQCLIYIETIALAANTADLKQIQEAFTQLETRWPTQDAVTAEQLMQIASRAYRSVDRSERDEQGEHYLDLLRDIAERYADTRDHDQAIGVYRLASTVARTIDSDQLAPIQIKLDHLVAVNELNERIKMLELSVQKNPQNAPAARELVNLLITRQNAPSLATKYVRSTRDEELIDLVTLAAKGVDQANAAAAMRVADWYAAMAEDEAQDTFALPMLQAAQQWYARFFSLYTRDDALAKRVVEMNNLVQLKISSLIKDRPDLQAAAQQGWLSLIAPPFDPDKFKTSETEFERDDKGGFTFNDGSLLIPCGHDNAYEARLTLTVNKDATDDQAAIRVLLPLNNRVLKTRYYLNEDVIATIDDVDETGLIKPAPGREGQRCELTFQVAIDDAQASFVMLYNGKPAMTWQGQIDEHDEYDREWLKGLDLGIDNAIYLICPANITLHAADYKARG